MRFLLLFCLSLIFISCKKEAPAKPEDTSKLQTKFSFEVQCNPLFTNLIAQVNSRVIFTNLSSLTTGSNTSLERTFIWSFGDGEFSIEGSPSHVYHKRGLFTIKLTSYLNDKPSDSTTQTIRIKKGQTELKSSMPYTDAVDIAETPESGALVLMVGYDNAYLNPTYTLVKVDSLLNKVWAKAIPGTSSRLTSLTRINATQYILSGNFTAGNTNIFSISKIDSSGSLLWESSVPDIQVKNNYTLPLSDGGFITIGNANASSPYLIMVKFDANGNELWRKDYNSLQPIQGADNILENSRGYVFASFVRGFNSNQIILTQLDFSGITLQQVVTQSDNGYTIFAAGVVHTANTYMVYTTNSRSTYLFDENLAFIKKNDMVGEYNNTINGANAKDGLFYIADGGFQAGCVSQLKPDGESNWRAFAYNTRMISCSSFGYGGNRNCKKVLCTTNNAVIGLSDGPNSPDNYNSSSAYLDGFTIDGDVR